MEALHPDGFGAPAVASPRQVSSLRKVINIVGCVVFFAIYWMIISGCRWPVTLDLFVSIGLTELNRFLNESRRMEYYKDSGDSGDQDQEKAALTEKDDAEVNLEKGAIEWSTSGKKECIAAIVGWREDPALFTRALTSYKDAQSCGFVIAGIDGDAEEDMEMVQVFNEVSEVMCSFMILVSSLICCVGLSNTFARYPCCGATGRDCASNLRRREIIKRKGRSADRLHRDP
jgi:hyaluronan synthase